MNKTCIYLRKSRADEELEKTLGEGETLSKHRKALLRFAKEKDLNIVEIKEEIVSGESLFFRPKMLDLLKEVEAKMYTDILVMDMQRLGRGNMQDQGIILETLKNSNTRIVTPMKTYDLSNDFDEEYSEFEAFMSRKELKMINRRMQGGRIRSVEDGNYIATNPPLGYDIAWIKKSRTLKINEYESEIINLIFKMYIEGNGAGSISDYLNSLGYKTKFDNNFCKSSVLSILKNPIYIGKVTWKKKEIKKSRNPNKVKDTRTRDKSEWIISDGKHKAIISNDTWEKVQTILNNRYHIPYQIVNGPTNPLAGILICSECGSKMIMRKLRGIQRILCINNNCTNISNRFDNIENNIIIALKQYLSSYNINVPINKKNFNQELYERQLDTLNKELNTLNEQKMKLFDFLERGIYSEELFLERSKNLDTRINNTLINIKELEKIISEKDIRTDKDKIDKFKKILDGYENTTNISLKNELMKSLVFKIEYAKSTKGKDFEIQLFPKLKP